MKHQRRFETDASRETAQTKALIDDLHRIVQIISDDISVQEDETGITDPSQPEYSLLAKDLKARRDNLLDTIAALERRLRAISGNAHS